MAYFLMSVFLHLRSSVSVSPHVHVLVCLSLYSVLYLFCLLSGLWLVGQSVTVFPNTRSSGSLVDMMAVLLSVFVYAYYTKLNSLIILSIVIGGLTNVGRGSDSTVCSGGFFTLAP